MLIHVVHTFSWLLDVSNKSRFVIHVEMLHIQTLQPCGGHLRDVMGMMCQRFGKIMRDLDEFDKLPLIMSKSWFEALFEHAICAKMVRGWWQRHRHYVYVTKPLFHGLCKKSQFLIQVVRMTWDFPYVVPYARPLNHFCVFWTWFGPSCNQFCDRCTHNNNLMSSTVCMFSSWL